MLEQFAILAFIISHCLIYGWVAPWTWEDYSDQRLMDFIKSLSDL